MHVAQLACGLLLKMLKHFEVLLNIFEFSFVKEIVESWLIYVLIKGNRNETETIKQSQCKLLFLTF